MREHGEPITVCVAKAGPRDRFETFVEAHVCNLAARVEVLCGARLDLDGGGRPVGPRGLLRAAAAGVRRVSRFRLDEGLTARALGRFLARRKVDVVLAEFGSTGVMISDACRRAGVPLVVHFHGYDAHAERMLTRWGPRYPALFADCAAVIAVSRHMAARLAVLGAPAHKVRVNPCGVECAQFRQTDPARNPPVFVAVGRFVEKKAPHLVILAFRRVLDACPEARLRMIGDGPLLPICADMAGALGMGGQVELAGRQPHEEVARAMAGARAFVQHSVTASDGDSEGMPVAVLEAGASGLPVVGTRHAGIAESVLEGETGLLVDERDVAGMAEHMIALARDPQLAGRLGAAARERIAAEFSMEKTIGALYGILAEAAGKGR